MMLLSFMFHIVVLPTTEPKFYLEETLGYEKTAPKGINFLARDGYFYATEFVEVEAKSMKERNK